MSYPKNLFGTVRERFEKKYIELPWTGCFIWLGAAGRYGSMAAEDGVVKGAHVVAWELKNGPVPKGMCVCHSCDNTLCVNSDHLFLGTHKENTHDMIRKGRHRFATFNAPKGDNHWTRKNGKF
jgi:hypothetical protein